MIRSKLATAVVVAIVALVAVMLLGQFLGIPFGIGYVETGSMEPAISPGDGFISLPPVLAGEISEGDVITYEAEEIGGGGLTTHRVVDVTPEGYITRGDANPFTDQDADEPPVTDAQVFGVPLQFGGSVLTIPYLGTVITGMQGMMSGLIGGLAAIPVLGIFFDAGIGTVFTVLGIAILAFAFLWDSAGDKRGRDRDRSRPGYVKFSLIVVILLALVLVPLTASMILPSETETVTIISSQSPSDDPTVIGVGESQDIEYRVSNNGFIPRVVMLEPASEGVTVSNQRLEVFHGQTLVSTVTLHAPDETGVFQRGISERHYPMVMPVSIIATLHAIHPWVAMAAIDLFVAVVITALVAILLGTHPLRLRSRRREVPLSKRIKEYLR